ncbi:hypothetical protein RQP46_005837 [Phenoliferia psychrophenolica]
MPFNGSEDGQTPTSQRAELAAAISGVSLAGTIGDASNITKKADHDKKQYIIVGDSEYVMKGITEWYPSWKRKGWKTASGKPPANLDQFHELDRLVREQEGRGVKIGFWHVDRKYNSIADKLAKTGKAKSRRLRC